MYSTISIILEYHVTIPHNYRDGKSEYCPRLVTMSIRSVQLSYCPYPRLHNRTAAS